MPSLADIPRDLLDPGLKLDFLHWLVTRPVDFYTAKEFMRLYSAETNQFFTSDEYDFVARKREI